MKEAPEPACSADERERAAEALAALPGGTDLISWFGYPTGFHDAGLLSVDVLDGSAARLRVHAFRDTGETGPDGYHVLDRHAVVTITLSGVRRICLDDLNMMPAIIPRLRFARSEDEVSVVWDSSYGTNGWITAREARIDLVPDAP